MATATYDPVIAVPTFVGSLLSFLASSIALTVHILVPPKRHFRHALVISLLVADFINSLNNTVSGAIIIRYGYSRVEPIAGSDCIANSWVGQFSVQAIDFNILIIALVVLATVVNSKLIDEPSTKLTALVCVAAWIPGTITSNIGLGLDVYGPVSGNWCWIRPEFLALRYALTHGWRIFIFLATVAIYTYIYVYLKRTFGELRFATAATAATASSSSPTTAEHLHSPPSLSDTQHIMCDDLPSKGSSRNLDFQSHPQICIQPIPTRSSDAQPPRHLSLPAPPSLKRMLLMNGYPIAYIVLWIPGVANRLAESTGGSPRWLKALQASTQFVGFANALTYGFSEQTRGRLRKRMARGRRAS